MLYIGFQLAGCKKDDNFTSDAVTDYMQLQKGKFIRYRLDSMRFTNFGQVVETVSYQAKDVVEDSITDNLGRPGWRIVRYLRDISDTSESAWHPLMTYQVIPSDNSIELSENNFRYIKLTTPVRDGRSWRGNGYIPDNPYQDLFDFSNDEDIQEWDYTYQDVGTPLTFNNTTYENTISVWQIADSANLPIEPGVPASKTHWVEKYARGVGLVYKEVEMWEFQPATNVSSYRHGYGLKLTIIDHN